jgi:hypothetical protein
MYDKEQPLLEGTVLHQAVCTGWCGVGWGGVGVGVINCRGPQSV